jgi:flagellar hook protein FlgE
MLGSFQTGVSGLQAFQKELEVIGNNIANVDTVGYKSSRMEFEDMLSFNMVSGTNPMQVGTGVAIAAISTAFTGGPINTTGITTDLAVNGEGFFVVRDVSSGATYVTRDGQFKRDATGYLITNNDMRVQGYTGAGPYTASSPIGDILINDAAAIAALNDTTTPAPTLASWSFDSLGQVNARLSDQVSGVMAQVVLQSFSNPQGLMKQGNNLYSYTTTAGPLAVPVAPGTGGLGSINSGALEASNVDLATEMTEMITAQRAFQANAKIVTTTDEVLQDLVNLKR